MTRWSTWAASVLAVAGAVLVTVSQPTDRAIEVASGIGVSLGLAAVLTPFALLGLSLYHQGGEKGCS